MSAEPRYVGALAQSQAPGGDLSRPAPLACVICGRSTKRGKPWCTRHVLRSSYAAAVSAEHDALVRACRAPDTAPVSEQLAREVELVTRALLLSRIVRLTAGHVARRVMGGNAQPTPGRIVHVWRHLGWDVVSNSKGAVTLRSIPS